MTIIDGKLVLGGLGTQYYESRKDKEIAEMMALTISAANNLDIQNSQDITAFMSSRINVVERVNGKPIPVEIMNMFFTEGGIFTDAPGFDTYYKHFSMKKSIPLQLKAFNHTPQDILDAKNAKINLMEKDAKDLQNAQRLYINKYLPNVRLLSLITGHSNTAEVSTKAIVGSDDDYVRAFGWIHGENIEDFMPVVKGMTHANHFRVKKNEDLVIGDINDIVDLLKSYDSYSGQGIVVLANSRVISDLGDLYETSEYRDGVLITGVKTPVIKGLEFLEVSQLNNDFMIFLDKGKNELMLKCVNPDENQRDFRLFDERDTEVYKITDGLPKGTKAFIFEEEYLIAERMAGAILDINPKRKEASGEMAKASIDALNSYAKLVEKMYKRVV